MLAELKGFFRRSGISTVGDLLTRGFALLFLPIYTAYLTPADYGILGVASVLIVVANIVLTLGLQGSATKFYYKLKDDERRDFYSSIWLFLIIVPGMVLLAVELSNGRLLGIFISQIPYSPYLRLALWTAYINVALLTLPKELARASGRTAAYTGIGGSMFLITAALTLLLVVGLNQGAEGALWARLFSASSVGIIGTAFILRTFRPAMNLRLLRQALLYGLPFLPHFLAHWILGASDRVILGMFVPLADVGVYTVGYQVGVVMSLLALGGNNALVPLFGRINISRVRDERNLVQVITYYVLMLAFGGLLIALFSHNIISLITPSDYHGASRVVPWVVLGYLFMGLYFPSMNSLNFVLGDVKWVWVWTTSAALLNIGLNISLIPIFGMIVAAITTAISYGFMFAAVFLVAQRKLPLPYEYRRISSILLAGVSAFLIGWNLAPDNEWLGLLVKIAALAAFPVVLWVTGFLNEEERDVALRMHKRVRGALHH